MTLILRYRYCKLLDAKMVMITTKFYYDLIIFILFVTTIVSQEDGVVQTYKIEGKVSVLQSNGENKYPGIENLMTNHLRLILVFNIKMTFIIKILNLKLILSDG